MFSWEANAIDAAELFYEWSELYMAYKPNNIVEFKAVFKMQMNLKSFCILNLYLEYISCHQNAELDKNFVWSRLITDWDSK